jgi:hypothetical protein
MTAAKELRVSDDDITYYIVPGSTADISFEGNQLEDTIFGAAYSSSETGLINWTVSGNAMYRGFAGYNSTVRSSGPTPTSFTGEAMSQVDNTQTYRITDDTKSVWDWTAGVTIYDGASAVASADIESINYLFGEVTFASGYSPTGAITADGDYLTMSAYGCANSFSLTQSADTTDTSCFETVQANGGFSTFRPTLLTADLELSGFYRAENDGFGQLNDRSEFVIELDVAGDGSSITRGIYKIGSYSQSGDVGGDEEFTLSLTLSVPENVKPFGWRHLATSTIPTGLLKILNAYENRSNIYVEYMPEGQSEYGYTGEVIVTDTSISSGVDAMVEASLSFQGTGAVSEVNPI